jgi:hypothetical protein
MASAVLRQPSDLPFLDIAYDFETIYQTRISLHRWHGTVQACKTMTSRRSSIVTSDIADRQELNNLGQSIENILD